MLAAIVCGVLVFFVAVYGVKIANGQIPKTEIPPKKKHVAKPTIEKKTQVRSISIKV